MAQREALKVALDNKSRFQSLNWTEKTILSSLEIHPNDQLARKQFIQREFKVLKRNAA